MNFQGEGQPEYGWIGIRITDEANATGEVVGWAYETNGGAIGAGMVPEPSSLMVVALGAGLLCNRYFRKRAIGR